MIGEGADGLIDLAPGDSLDPLNTIVVSSAPKTLMIACGALARELVSVVRASAFAHLDIACLPADLHNRPERIAPAVQAKIKAARPCYDRILCLYGDCGTGGELDRVLQEENVERIEGPHCYAVFTGLQSFDAFMAEEPGTFFLTDYLVRHFERLVIQGLGLDRHPELLPTYFGNYRRVIYLVQVPDGDLDRRARAAAERLGLAYEARFTGLGPIAAFAQRALATGSPSA